MGQAIGLPCPVEGAKAFTNLPREAIAGLLTSYGINGESWSLNVESMKEIVMNAQYSTGTDASAIVALFDCFDTDLNGLIDTLEWLVSLALVSGMNVTDKVQFVFSLYDFEKSGLLGRDAVCLLLRSAVKGLAKVCPTQVLVSSVTFQDLEDAADVLFYGSPRANGDYVSVKEFQTFCTRHPVLVSWLTFFSSVSALQDTENVPVVFRGSEAVVAPLVCPPLGEGKGLAAAHPFETAVSVMPSDFDSFYSPSIRAPLDMVVLKPPEEGGDEPLPVEEPAPAPVVEVVEPQGEKAEGEEGEGGEKAEGEEGDGEEKGEEEGEAEAAGEEEGGEGGEGDGEPVKAPKPKVLKPPPPFDTPDLTQAALPWFEKTELMRPEEIPPFRIDRPEDQLEPLWVHGLGSGRFDAPEMSRFALYISNNDNSNIVYPAARMVLSLTRKIDDDLAAAMAEEGYDPDADPAKGPFVWTQQQMTGEHAHPISCCAIDKTGRYLVTGDQMVGVGSAGSMGEPSRIVLWDLAPASTGVQGSVEVSPAIATGVRVLDFSPSGRLFLALLGDHDSTLCVYQTATQKLLFTAPLSGALVAPTMEGASGRVRVTDVRFGGNDNVLVVTGSHGVHFYIDEGASLLGPKALVCYEKRTGVYGAPGGDAEGVVATVAQRLTRKDECVVGTALGHLTLWRGRCCAQLVNAHRGPVTSITYANPNPLGAGLGGVVVSGGRDNRIQLYQLTYAASTGVQRGLGELTLMGSIDLLSLSMDLLSTGAPPVDRTVRSLALHATGTKVLVALGNGELRELACDFVRLKPRELPAPVIEKTPEEQEAEDAAAAQAAAEGEASGEAKSGEAAVEGEEPPAPVEKTAEELEAEALAAEAAEKERKRRKLGDDMNGGPIVSCHWLGGKGAGIDGVAKLPAGGGFITNGRDGAVRLWQTTEGAPQMCTKVFSLPPIAGLPEGAEVYTKMALSAEFVALTIPGGAVQVLSLPDLVPVYLHQHTPTPLSPLTGGEGDLWATDVKFSPDGTTLALVCSGAVVLYTITPSALTAAVPAEGGEGEAPPPVVEGEEGGEGGASAAAPAQFLTPKEGFDVAEFAPHTLDFSADAQYVRLTDAARGVLSVRQLFYTAPPPVEPVEPPPPVEGEEGEAAVPAVVEPVEPPKGIPVGTECVDPEILRPMTFATNSVPCSWDLKGVWNAHAGALAIANSSSTEPILACDRNEGLFVAALASGHLALTRVPQPLFVPCPGTLGAPPGQQHVPSHVGRVGQMVFMEEGSRLVTVGQDDGIIMLWKVTYDTEEAEPTSMATVPNLKKPLAEGEEEANDEAPPEPAADEEEEVVEEEEAEELDDDGNPIPRPPVLYDTAEEDDLFDGRRMKVHLALAPRPQTTKLALARARAQGKAYNPAAKDRLSAIVPWAAQVGLSGHMLDALAVNPPADGAGCALPTDDLQLHWVHGYSCRLSRGAVRYTSEGTIVYPAASLAVTLDKTQRQQLHTMAHSDELTCLDVHLKTGVAASAHKGAGEIFACVWEPATGKVLQRLSCGVCNGVSAVAFSPDGSLLMVSLQDEQHQMLLFDWRRGFLKARVNGGRRKVLCLAFSLCPSPPPGDDAPPPPPPDVAAALARASLFPPANPLAPPLNLPVRVLQAGVGHFSLLELKAPVVGVPGAATVAQGGRVLSSRAGSYGPDVKKVNVLCCAALPLPEEGGDEFVMGMANGQLGVVGRGERAISRMVDVQKGAVTALWVVLLPKNEEGQLFKLVTGGTNGFVKVLDQSFEPLAEFNLYRLPEAYGNLHPLGKVRGVKSICVDRFNRKILFGTAGGEIGEMDLETGADLNRGPLVRSHFRDELHSVATHPLRQLCLTAGDDKTLRVWNLETAAMETSIDLPDTARCVTFSPNGLLVAVGLGGAVRGLNRPVPRPCAGHVAIVSYLQGVLNIVHRTTDAKAPVTSVVFSPQGDRLYCGSLDGVVYVYDALNNFKLVTRMYSVKESVVSLDISMDGRYVIAMGPMAEVTVWDTTTFLSLEEKEKHALLSPAPGAPILQYFVRQGTFGADCAGAFPFYGRSEDVLSLCKSADSSLLVTGLHSGQLQLRTYPSKALGAPCRPYHGHSAGGISKVAFSVGDKYLLSVGRDDRVMLQWKVVRSGVAPVPLLQAHGKPPACPEQDGDLLGQRKSFEASLALHGENFAEAFSRNDRALSEPLTLTLAAGFGCGTPLPSAIPTTQAMYVGQGDVLTVQGRSITCLSGADRLTTRHWSQYSPLGVAAGGATPSHVPGSAYATGSNIATVTMPMLPVVGEEIGAMAVSPCRRYLALASRSPQPLTHNSAVSQPGATTILQIFSAGTGTPLATLSSSLVGEATSLAFSHCGTALAYLLNDAHHTMGLYTTPTGGWLDSCALTPPTPTGAQDMASPVLSFLYSPRPFFHSLSDRAAPVPLPPDAAAAAADAAIATTVPEVTGEVQAATQYYDIVTAGASGVIKFWGINGRNLVCKYGDFNDVTTQPSDPSVALRARPPFTAVCGLHGADLVVTGDAHGELWVWQGSSATRATLLGSHNNTAVTALLPFTVVPETEYTSWTTGQGFLSAGCDSVCVWSWVYGTWCERTRIFDLAQLYAAPSLASRLTLDTPSANAVSLPRVTGLSVDHRTKRLLVTLATNTLLELAIESTTNVASVITQGVSATPTAIAAHPLEPHTVVTADSHRLLKVWDVSAANRGVTATVTLPRPASSICFHASGALVVGLEGGTGAGPTLMWMNFTTPYAPGSVPRGLVEVTEVPITTPAPPAAKGKKQDPPVVCMAPLHEDFNKRISGEKIHSISMSSDGTVIALGLDKGRVALCLLSRDGTPAVMGSLQAHEEGVGPVVALDLSVDGKYLRTFGPSPVSNLSPNPSFKIETHIWRLGPAGSEEIGVESVKEVTDRKELKGLFTARWTSCSSPAAPEAVATVPYATPAAVVDYDNEAAAAGHPHPVVGWGRGLSSLAAHVSAGGDGSMIYPATAAALTVSEIVVRLQKELDTRHVPDAPVHAKRIAADLKEQHEGHDCLSTVARRLREHLREVGVNDYQKLAKTIMRDFRSQAAANLKAKGYLPGKGLVAAGYSDGTIGLFRHPAVANNGPVMTLAPHNHGKVLTAFTCRGQLCSIGETDGALLVWDVR